MFTKVLIANRGEIACRVIRTLKKLGIASVAVYSEADAQSNHVAMADEAVCIGPAAASESYLRGNVIVETALQTGAQAIHPGYGFLSENPEFAQMCTDAGIAFIGPTPEQMRSFGLKHTAREIASQSGVPMAPGSGLLETPEAAIAAAKSIGFPVMLKATAGGGGIGMRLCRAESELTEAFATVQRLGKNNFKHAGLYLEKYIERARHIEVQIFGDGRGRVVALGERDCSAQRRNQKVIEETPAPGIDETLRKELFAAAIKLGQAVGYQSAGTVEFIFDDDTNRFYFLEVNTRLQVEHTITEEVLGEDLVEWMIKQAAGELSLDGYEPKPHGAAIQVRLYAEDPSKNFQPSSGMLTEASFPSGRIDTWVATGTEITSFYDPLIGKLIVKGKDRADAVEQLRDALHHTRLAGVETNLYYLRAIIDQPTFAEGRVTTGFLNQFKFTPATIDVLKSGMQTTVQDGPGRLGYWNIGVPPSGPMDGKSFALAASLVGNPPEAAGLECTLMGPTLRFNVAATIAIVGADMQATVDGKPVAMNRAIDVLAGSVLEMKAVKGPGARTYVAFRDGLDVPSYLGSRSTFTLGKFGGHAGRALRVGDVLRVSESVAPAKPQAAVTPPALTNNWEIAVLYGPHGAPDFFLPEDIDMLFATSWKVHHHSDRTGIRLIGPHPKWARTDGGEAGLHPSNIHDNAYAVGTIDFTGNLPIILGPDGPSLGGFVCPATIIQADLWKIGQLKAGDTIKFVPVSQPTASAMEVSSTVQPKRELGSPIIHTIPAKSDRPAVVYRQDGDKYLLVEYGPLALDLNLRFRIHVLMQRLEADQLPGIIDLTPGIRSLHIHFNSRVLPQDRLMAQLIAIEDELPDIDRIEVPTRIVHLPLSWDDPACQLAIQKYMQVVRADAPWCPSNIEFIRRINGLGSIEEVKRIVCDASYLVLGLGDVYLGAPVATPLDPRHRLVTTKYNPARTWTAENSVGIGGAYLCVYGMEGPGGYQFVGRTCQMWNPHRQTADFVDGKPWLLRFFDQIRFYPVSAAELLKFRTAFPLGQVKLDITHETFSLHAYNEFLKANQPSITAFKTTQQAAFDAERRWWEEAGLNNYNSDTFTEVADTSGPAELPAGWTGVFADISGNMWKVQAKKGDIVQAGQVLAIVESMKTEIPVISSAAGKVSEIYCAEGKMVSAGQLLFCIQPT